MLLDKLAMFADDLAYDGTSTVVDLQSVRPGPGEPVKIWIQGSASLTACTGVAITDGATSSAADAFLTYVCTLPGKIVQLELPSDVARYVKLTLTTGSSLSAGTWSAGVTLEGVQTNL
jgi:hypothetical protein